MVSAGIPVELFIFYSRFGDRAGFESRAPKRSRGVEADGGGGGGGPAITTHYRVLYGSAARCTRTAVMVRRRETDRGRSSSHWSW